MQQTYGPNPSIGSRIHQIKIHSLDAIRSIEKSRCKPTTPQLASSALRKTSTFPCFVFFSQGRTETDNQHNIKIAKEGRWSGRGSVPRPKTTNQSALGRAAEAPAPSAQLSRDQTALISTEATTYPWRQGRRERGNATVRTKIPAPHGRRKSKEAGEGRRRERAAQCEHWEGT